MVGVFFWQKKEVLLLYQISDAFLRAVQAYKLSIADIASNKRSLSVMKHACLLEASPYIDDARFVLEDMMGRFFSGGIF